MSSKPIDLLLSDEIAEHHINRSLTIDIPHCYRLLEKLSLPFRVHVERYNSNNRGVFLEFVNFLANNGDQVLNEHLTAPHDDQLYLSPQVKNEMI